MDSCAVLPTLSWLVLLTGLYSTQNHCPQVTVLSDHPEAHSSGCQEQAWLWDPERRECRAVLEMLRGP